MVRSWEQHLDKNLALQWGIPMVSNWAKHLGKSLARMTEQHLDWGLVQLSVHQTVVHSEKHWVQHLVMQRETVSALRLARKKAKRLVMR
jgi:hypothetical protein